MSVYQNLVGSPPSQALNLYFRLNYYWRLFAKTISFTLFGIGGVVLATLLFPLFRLLVHPRKRYQRLMRRMISLSFFVFVQTMIFLGLISVKVRNKALLRAAKGMMVVANHPSLIDVVILIAYLPQADCIVKSKLWSNFFLGGVVSSVYIRNSLNFDEMVDQSRDSIAHGNTLVIFPEGTRTSPTAEPKVRRGCAHIALRVPCRVLPIRIDSSEPIGIRKNDPFFSLPARGRVRFELIPSDPIEVESFQQKEMSLSARSLTNEIRSRIFS